MLLTAVPSVPASREETHRGHASAEPRAPPSHPTKPWLHMSPGPVLSRLSPLLPLCSRLSASPRRPRAQKQREAAERKRKPLAETKVLGSAGASTRRSGPAEEPPLGFLGIGFGHLTAGRVRANPCWGQGWARIAPRWVISLGSVTNANLAFSAKGQRNWRTEGEKGKRA